MANRITKKLLYDKIDLLNSYTKEQYVTDKQAGKTIITDIIGGKESISRGSLIEDVKIDFGDLKNRKILINFESPMCKRIVCEL